MTGHYVSDAILITALAWQAGWLVWNVRAVVRERRAARLAAKSIVPSWLK